MSLLVSCHNVSKSFGGHPIFRDLTFGIEERDRIGMIGPNGSGKSTLLKILAGLETAEHGTVSHSLATRIGYLPQETTFADNLTIHHALTGALHDSHMEDYEREIAAEVMWGKCGFHDAQQVVGTLSGGWRKRLAIACQWIREPNLLLLDEPTNHLDVEGIVWLENLLTTARCAYLVVSHDRYFLEHISARVMELNQRYPLGHFNAPGKYSDFLDQREIFLQGQLQQEAALANRVRREVEWLRRGPAARTTKSSARIKSAHALIEDLGEIAARNAHTKKVAIDFTASERRTKELVVAKNIRLAFGERVLVNDLTLKLSPGTRLGLLGHNGSGKTTLIKALTGALTPSAGTMEFADDLRTVFLDQHRATLDDALTLRKALAPHGDQIIYRERPMHLVSWARRFLFSADQLSLPISQLSGGERARILIARMMQQPADLLILDEPTNDLDIPTLEILEESLLDFPGALLLVTHDRYLLDRVSTQLLALDGQGGATTFADYSQWEAAQGAKSDGPLTPALSRGEREKSAAQKKSRKLSYKEQREWDAMEENIAQAERQLTACQQTLTNPAIAADAAQLHDACTAVDAAQKIVDHYYQRWGALELLQDS